MRNKQIRIFESSIERLGRILSKKWKIKVVFKHNECKTNGSTIYLPVLPDNADKSLLDAMQGHLDHEASHVVNSDFSVIQNYVDKVKTLTILNAMEDPRIENKWINVYPGSRINLSRANEWAYNKIAEVKENPDGTKTRPWDNLTDLGKLLHTSITLVQYGEDHWFIKNVVEPEILDKVKTLSLDLFKQAKDLDSTVDLLPLTKELMKRLQEEDQEEDQSQDQSQDQGESEEEQGSPLNCEEAESNPQDEILHKKSNSTSGNENTINKKVTSKPNNWNPSNEELEKDKEILDRSEALKEAAKNTVSEEDKYLIYTTEGDKIEAISDGDRIQYKRFMQEAVRLIAPLKRRMSRSLLSTNTSRWESDKLRGKINTRRLYQVVTGTSKRVFRQKVESEDFDTAVLLMIDHSGSMSGDSLDLAAKTSIILGELFNQLSIPFAVYGFSTETSTVAVIRKKETSAREQDLYSRWGNMWIGQYKDFEDSWHNAGHKMVRMQHNEKINTYDGETLKLAANMLMARKEKRKILFWLNDGSPCPNSGDNQEAHTKYARDCAKEVANLVELIPLGIRCDISDIYKNAIQIDKIEDLPKTCLLKLDALLRQGKEKKTKELV